VKWTALVEASPTTDDLCRWAGEFPAANVAILLEPSMLVAIDCDSDGALGEATALGLPRAPVSVSARGRRYLYRRPAGAPAARATRRGQSRALDILSAGVLVMPPSRHATGVRYEWIVDDMPCCDAPGWAVDLLATADTPAGEPAVLPTDLPVPALGTLAVTPRMKALILHGPSADPRRYPSRSEALFAVLQALICAGIDDATIAGIVMDPAHAIGDKPRELGRRWLASEIARARAKSDVELF